MHPFYLIRVLGGLLYLTGALIMAFNLWKTATGSDAEATDASMHARMQPAE
jgi:cytochrome c oxidase cbb3-type subunit 1